MYWISGRNWIIDRLVFLGEIVTGCGNNASTRAVTRIFRAGRVFHANYSCYLCPACAERVRGLFAKTFQRDSSSSLLVALYRPASFLLSSPRLFVAPRLFLLLVLFLFSFFSFSFCVERHVSAARIAGTLCIASNILCDLIALALSRIFFFFFLYSIVLWRNYIEYQWFFFFFVLIRG